MLIPNVDIVSLNDDYFSVDIEDGPYIPPLTRRQLVALFDALGNWFEEEM